MKIIRLFSNVHMGLAHKGLIDLAKAFKIDAEQIADGSLLMFMNTKGDKLKILGKQGKVLAYLRTKNGARLAMDAIQYIPETFGGGSFNYEKALEKALRKRLEVQKVPLAVSPLELFRAKQGAGLISSRKNQQTSNP